MIFNETGALHPKKTAFDLTHEKLLTCEAGKLIPICLIDCVPGDHFTLRQQALIRMQPMSAPLMETLKATFHYYFVPYRLLDENFEEFITGGKEGTYEGTTDIFNPNDDISSGRNMIKHCGKHTLWDYFGFPTANFQPNPEEPNYQFNSIPKEDLPIIFPWKAYNKIYNEYYRDENLQNEVDLLNNEPLNRAWKKDYFTSALPWQQRGIAPSIPLTGIGNVEFSIPTGSSIGITSIPTQTITKMKGGNNDYDIKWSAPSGDYPQFLKVGTIDTHPSENATAKIEVPSATGTVATKADTNSVLGNNSIDFENVGTFDVADLRLITQIQKFMERNARGGVRYTEFLGQHFGVAPNDARLDRAEYIGGASTTIIVSEVLQTSESGETAQGNMSGHGIAAGDEFVGNYFVEEFGLIMGIMSIMPRAKYYQGISRHWTKRSRYDYYFPEFMNLSEQAIHEREIYLQENKIENEKVFGFQGRYDEYRIEPNTIHGDFRDLLDYWHMGRRLTQAPNLNDQFIKCDPTVRNFLVHDEPPYLVQLANIIKAVRPMPYMAEPGLIDHN